MYLGYSYMRRMGGFLKSPWTAMQISGFHYNEDSLNQLPFSENGFGKLLGQLEGAILAGEQRKHKQFALRVEPGIVNTPGEQPYRIFTTYFICRNSFIGGWSHLYPKYSSFFVKQSDTLSDEDLHSDGGFNEFFQELRHYFREDNFPARVGGRDDELAIFFR